MINWPVYEARLRRRGDLTLWLDRNAVAGWAVPRRRTPGGQPLYSDLAIELMLLRAHHRDTQAGVVALGVQVLNRMIRDAKPVVIRRS